MDTSEQYIKMCEQAVMEIQERWQPSVGDFCCCTERTHNNSYRESCVVEEINSGLSLMGLKNKYQAAWFEPSKNVWLPRQDQLQAIVGNDWRYVFSGLMWWYADADIEYLGIINSMEQLLLAYVMKRQYGKTWNGEEWING